MSNVLCDGATLTLPHLSPLSASSFILQHLGGPQRYPGANP